MITAEEIGSQKLYDAILKHIKNTASFFKKITMKGITKNDAQECGWLSLDDMELKDLEFLRFFPNLTTLMLSKITGLQNVEGLRYCPNMADIEFYNTAVSDLNGIRYCVHLNNFQYYPNQNTGMRTDLSFLQELGKLECLDMVNCNISDVSPVSWCKALSYLNLSKNPIKKISPLSTLPLLGEIDLSECNLETLEDLSSFPALKAMTLYNNYFSEEEKERLTSLYPTIHFGFESGEVHR